LEFVYNVSKKFNISSAAARVGLIQWSFYSWVHIPLQANEKKSFLDSVCLNGICTHCFPCSMPTRLSEVNSGKTECVVTNPEYVGDSYCDSDVFEYNTPECGWDGGDCCESTCVDQEFQCGVDSPLVCVDPDGKAHHTLF